MKSSNLNFKYFTKKYSVAYLHYGSFSAEKKIKIPLNERGIWHIENMVYYSKQKIKWMLYSIKMGFVVIEYDSHVRLPNSQDYSRNFHRLK